jgi:anthranilate synthase component 1
MSLPAPGGEAVNRPVQRVRWLDRVPDLLGLAQAEPATFPYLLESAARGELGGCSMLLFASGAALVAGADGEVQGPGVGDSFLDRLSSWFAQEGQPGAAAQDVSGPQLPFGGGWFIYLGYEMAAQVEPTLRLPRNTTGLPNAIAHRCPGAVIVVHGRAPGEPDRAAVVAESAEILEHLLERVDRVADGDASADEAPIPPLEAIEEEDPLRFVNAVRRIHEYLRAGDVFQVNVSRPWTGRFRSPPDPCGLYASLRRANPAPFAGLMRWREGVLLSSSPERLVQIVDRNVQTRPIAGTRPRGRDADHDQALSRELLGNLKERAEHVMLIDLERNDLGRVCRPGTVEVNELMVVESYTHVHHIVSNVRGTLTPEAGPVEAMGAVFPGGTITGCPKVRCMEIIAELEGQGRGFYTGSMGYLDRSGNMDLNILIRSMLLRGRQFSFRTGAGIVADSEAEHEVQETADKARGMLLAVGACDGENDNA